MNFVSQTMLCQCTVQHFVYFLRKERNRPHHLFAKTLPCFFASGPNGMLLGTNLFSKICGLSKRLHFKDKRDCIAPPQEEPMKIQNCKNNKPHSVAKA